jgi:thiamine-phosphate pyrophosphorylase
VRLLVLTDRDQSRSAGRDLPTTVAAAVAGGASGIVFREKDLPETQRRAVGERVAAACRGAELIVASDATLARALESSTVHLAAGDPWPEEDFDLAIGRSCHGAIELREAAVHGATYAMVSPVFETASKPGYGPALGLDGLGALVADATVPVYALGGLRPGDGPACLAAGATGIAVMSGVMAAPDPTEAVRAYLDQEVGG